MSTIFFIRAHLKPLNCVFFNYVRTGDMDLQAMKDDCQFACTFSEFHDFHAVQPEITIKSEFLCRSNALFFSSNSTSQNFFTQCYYYKTGNPMFQIWLNDNVKGDDSWTIARIGQSVPVYFLMQNFLYKTILHEEMCLLIFLVFFIF